MNRLVYSILLALLLTLNLTTIIMATPTIGPSQAPSVTADIEVLSPLNVTDPLLLGKNISLYLSDCCLLAVIDIQSLEDQGVDVGLVDVLFTPNANWWGMEILKYVDINSTTNGWVQNPATGNWYSIIRSESDPNTVLLAINLSTIDLEYANVHRGSFGDIVVMNLYRKPLWLRIRDYNPPSPPDSALSVNRFAVIKKPDIDWNDYVTVSYSYGGNPRDKAKVGTTVTITISLPDEIKYLLNITGAEPELTFDDFEVINVTMYNLDESSDSEIILSIIGGSVVDSSSKYLGTEGVSFDASHTVITITGTLQEFVPLAVHEDASFEPKAFYGFHIYLKLNKTSDVGYGLNLTEIGTPSCPNVLDNDTIMFTAEFEGNVTEEYVEVWASIEIDTTYPDAAYDPSDLNPGDVVKFKLHNVPVPYNDTSLLYAILFDTDYTDIYVAGSDADYLSSESTPEDGILVYNVTLPEGEWGGRVAYITFIYRSIGYEIRISETPECDPLTLTVYPYADLFVLRNLPEDIVLMDGVIYRQFVHYSETDYTTAPGDYILVKGYGFITEGGVDVYLNDTIKLVKVLEIHSENDTMPPYSFTFEVDPGLAPGQVILVLKINDTSTGNVIPPAPNNKVTVTGTLHSDTNTYTLGTPLDINYREDLLKILVNPGLVYDAIVQTVYVKQTRLGSFDVYYDLVEVPGEPGNDTFVEDTWEEPFILEVIGMESSDFTVVFVNTYPHGYTYDWMTINLDHGYANKSFVGEKIPFIAYGLYTIVIDNGTDTFVPEAINGSNVFMVHTNLDIDVGSDDTEGLRCDDITFNIVGGLPDDTLTFRGTGTITVDSDIGGSISRSETISVDISTNSYGIGSTTVSGTVFYDTTELTSDVHSYMDSLSLSGNGTVSFTIIYDAIFNYYTNTSLTIWYSHWGTNTEREFILELTGSVNYYEVVDEIDWSASVLIPRTRVVITVPEVVMPGDNITVQIIVHKSDVEHDQIVPSEMWDLLYPYWISIRLVDLSASDGRWSTLYGGWLMFDSRRTEIALPNGKTAELKRVFEDVDGDGVEEIVFLAIIPAPVLGYDTTLRVDVNITLAFENTGNVTDLELADYDCTFEGNYTGARMWAVQYTWYLYGGDDQLTTVLGLLEAKLDYINDTTVYIKAKVDDIWTYITVDLMDFLEAMNNSIITRIDDSTATILTRIGEINVSLSDLMMELADEIMIKIDDSTAMIIANISAVNETLYLKIDECCSDIESLINTIYYDLSAKLDSINTTITYYGDTLEMKIDTMNDSLTMLIIDTRDEIIDTITNLIYTKLESMESNIIGNITYYGDTLEMKLDMVNETLYFKIEDEADRIIEELSSLITTKVDEILSRIDSAESRIIGNITYYGNMLYVELADVNSTLYLKIEDEADEIISEIEDYVVSMLGEILNRLDDVESNIVANITYWGDTLELKIDNVNATLHLAIQDAKEDLEGLITTVYTDILDAIASAKEEIEANITYWGDTLYMKIDAVNETLYFKIEECCDNLTALVYSLETTILGRLDELEANVILTVLAVNDSIVRHIDVVADDLRYDILLRIDEAESTLSDLITVKADEIMYYVNETATTIIAKVDDSTVTIVNAIDSAEADLEVYINDKVATIRSDIAAVKTDTENIIGLVNALQTSVNNLDAKLVAVNDSLYTLVLSVGDDVKATITGKAEDILNFLNDFKTTTDTGFSNVLSAIDELSSELETAESDILANLSSVHNDLATKLSDLSTALSDARTSIEGKITKTGSDLSSKADSLASDLKKTVEDKSDAVNSNVTTFSLTLLILVVVLIGLVGYSVIAARRVK